MDDERGAAAAASAQAQAAAQAIAATATPNANQKETGADEHWAVIMKRLAPAGYKRSPAWQQKLIDRVAKQLTRRDSARTAKPHTNAVDLSALGVPTVTMEAMQADEARLASMANKTAAASRTLSPRGGGSSAAGAPAATATAAAPAALDAGGSDVDVSGLTLGQRKQVERQNAAHHYARLLQTEELQQQDLRADIKQVSDEIARLSRQAKGEAREASERKSRVRKQLDAIENRCTQLLTKASQTATENASVQLGVNDLRRDKMRQTALVDQLRASVAKMDEDIAFLDQTTRSALDAREKIRTRFYASQRDVTLEREAKQVHIDELVQRAAALDKEWEAVQAEVAEEEEDSRIHKYVEARHKRGELEYSDRLFGYLVNQVQGWNEEFERLREFTAMDMKFEPGSPHIIDEITSRFLEKERANTSLLSFLNEQSDAMSRLEEEQRSLAVKADELRHELDRAPERQRRRSSTGGRASAVYGGAGAEAEADGEEGAEGSAVVEGLLDSVCAYVERIGKAMWRSGTGPAVLDHECTLGTLEEWLRMLHARSLEMRQAAVVLAPHAEPKAASLLTRWCAAQPEVHHPPVEVIHQSLVRQAVRNGGDFDDEDDEVTSRLRARDSRSSPFDRVKVDRSRERHHIVDWAKRTRKATAERAALPSILGGSAATPSPSRRAGMMRASRSAPRLRQPELLDGGGSLGKSPLAERSTVAAREAASYTALHGSAPPERGTGEYGRASKSLALETSLSTPALRAGGQGGARTRSSPWSKGSGPASRTPNIRSVSKDAGGTMIYLLGKQRSSLSGPGVRTSATGERLTLG